MNAICYDCEYRGDFPGSAHSSCHHPELGEMSDNAFGVLVDMARGKFKEAAQKLQIHADPTGIQKGWFLWPANFDPVWLLNCDGFKRKLPKP
jgi:hypothetical protein